MEEQEANALVRELRMGNQLLHEPTGHIVQFSHADFIPRDGWVFVLDSFFKVPSKLGYIKPIPITPKILNRCGWSMNGYDGHPFIEAFSPGMGQRFDLWWMNDILHCKSRYQPEDGSPIEMKHIKFLHQIQNLYFALTGRELEVKP